MESIYKNISIQDLIDTLTKRYNAEQRKILRVYISSDEELNNIYRDFYIDTDTESGYIVLAGLTGSEIE